MPKRNCISRAEWRLQTGRSPESISAHYRLDCDYGTAVVGCWEKGGSEPIYVCESHAKELGPSRQHGGDARIITAEPDHREEAVKHEEPIQKPEIISTKSQGQDSPKAAESSPETKPVRVETRAVRVVSVAPAKSRPRDPTFGNSAKAMVDEAIWNLAPGDFEIYRSALRRGKPAKEAAQAAGGQLAVIHQKISEYSSKLEAMLAESKATITVEETIDKPLEQAMLEIISNGATSETDKDAGIQRLGAVQEWVKRGMRGEITLLQANEMILAIAERLNWGGSSDVSEELRPVYQALYGNLKNAIRAALPKAQNLHDRLTNLYAAKCEMDGTLQGTKEMAQTAR